MDTITNNHGIDAWQIDLTGDFPAVVYLPFEQTSDRLVAEMTYFLRTAGNPSGVAGTVREIVHQADARIPVEALSTQTAQIDAWVESSCHTVRVSGADSTGTLYQCGTR